MHLQSLLGLLSQAATLQYLPSIGSPADIEESKLLSTTTIPYRNSEVVITTYSLPDFDSYEDDNPLGTLAATNVCGTECQQSCFSFPRKRPAQDDCTELAKWLKDQSGTFVVSKKTTTHANYGTCYTYFLNQASKDYEYCYSEWAANVDALNEGCLDSHNGAYCAQKLYSWGIELSGSRDH